MYTAADVLTTHKDGIFVFAFASKLGLNEDDDNLDALDLALCNF